jgi:hypothetical protein
LKNSLQTIDFESLNSKSPLKYFFCDSWRVVFNDLIAFKPKRRYQNWVLFIGYFLSIFAITIWVTLKLIEVQFSVGTIM